MGDPQSGEGSLEFRTRIPTVGAGGMTEQGESVGVDGQRQLVLKEETAKVFEVVPGGVGRDEGRSQELSRMIVHGQQERLLIRSLPPLMNRRVMLPKLIDPGTFPPPARFGRACRPTRKIGEMRANKGGDGLAMALKTKAGPQFIGDELKVGRPLERDKGLEELRDFLRPIGPMISTGSLGREVSTIVQPQGAESIQMSAADAQLLRGIRRIDLAAIKLL